MKLNLFVVNVMPIGRRKTRTCAVPVLDDNVISFIETDEEFNDDDDIDDTQANYLDGEEKAEFDDDSSDNTDDDTDHNSDTHNNSDTSDND